MFRGGLLLLTTLLVGIPAPGAGNGDSGGKAACVQPSLRGRGNWVTTCVVPLAENDRVFVLQRVSAAPLSGFSRGRQRQGVLKNSELPLYLESCVRVVAGRPWHGMQGFGWETRDTSIFAKNCAKIHQRCACDNGSCHVKTRNSSANWNQYRYSTTAAQFRCWPWIRSSSSELISTAQLQRGTYLCACSTYSVWVPIPGPIVHTVPLPVLVPIPIVLTSDRSRERNRIQYSGPVSPSDVLAPISSGVLAGSSPSELCTLCGISIRANMTTLFRGILAGTSSRVPSLRGAASATNRVLGARARNGVQRFSASTAGSRSSGVRPLALAAGSPVGWAVVGTGLGVTSWVLFKEAVQVRSGDCTRVWRPCSGSSLALIRCAVADPGGTHAAVLSRLFLCWPPNRLRVTAMHPRHTRWRNDALPRRSALGSS